MQVNARWAWSLYLCKIMPVSNLLCFVKIKHDWLVSAQAEAANGKPASTAARNKQLASRMRDALASNRAAYNSLKKETALFRCAALLRCWPTLPVPVLPYHAFCCHVPKLQRCYTVQAPPTVHCACSRRIQG